MSVYELEMHSMGCCVHTRALRALLTVATLLFDLDRCAEADPTWVEPIKDR